MEVETNIKLIEEEFKNGNYIKCQSDIYKLLEVTKNNRRLRNLLSLTYFQLGKTEEAIEILTDIVEEDPLFYEGLVNLGFFKHRLEEFSQAEDYFIKALACNDEKIEAKTGLCYVLLATNKDGKRDAEIEKMILDVLQKEPLNIPFRQIAGRFYKYKGHWEVAIKFLERVLTDELIYDLFECIYEVDNQKELLEFIKFCNNNYKCDQRMAELTDFACDQNEILNSYDFCPQSLNYIKNYKIFENSSNNSILFSGHKKLNDSKGMIIFDNFQYSSTNYDNEISQKKDEVDINKILESYLVKYINENSEKEIDIIDKWPNTCEVRLKKMQSDNIFKKDYKALLSGFFLDPKAEKSKLNIQFDYLIEGLTNKRKKVRNKKFKLNNNNLIIYPSFINFNILNKDDNFDLYQINIFKKD